MSVLLGKNGRTVVTLFRHYENFDKKAKQQELENVIYLIYMFNKMGARQDLDSYIKSKLCITYDQVESDIQLLIMSGFLTVQTNEIGKSVYEFNHDVMYEVERIVNSKKCKNKQNNVNINQERER